jgi:hypothetical protein
MKPKSDPGPRWSTSSFADLAETSPGELSDLGDHMNGCKINSGRLFAMRVGAEHVHGFVASRLVTSLVVIILLLGLVQLVL